jgi:hypothetical protein
MSTVQAMDLDSHLTSPTTLHNQSIMASLSAAPPPVVTRTAFAQSAVQLAAQKNVALDFLIENILNWMRFFTGVEVNAKDGVTTEKTSALYELSRCLKVSRWQPGEYEELWGQV